MKTTLDELIERLEEYREVLGGDTEVRLMTQPNYPLECTVAGAISGEEMNSSDEDDDSDVESNQVVYIVEDSNIGYGSKRAWDCL